MIIFDQDAIIEPEPMIPSAADGDRIFLQQAQARHRLAGIDDDRVRPGNRLDVSTRHRRNPREMLQEIERDALGGEKRLRFAGDPREDFARRDHFAIADRRFDL